MVVFVDDLDKCLPLNGLALLESIKLFFAESAPIVLICSVDADVLAQSIRAKYAYAEPHFADSYLQKIFEFSYQVPTISAVQVRGLVQEIFRRSGLEERGAPGEQLNMEKRVVEDVLCRIGLTFNPRSVKRAFNRFVWFLCHEPALDAATATEESALDAWLSWLLMTDYWRDLRELVALHGEAVFRELGNRATGHSLFPHSNEAAKVAFDALPESRSLVEFFRVGLPMPKDPHLPEAQTVVREAVMRFAEIDATLRSYGL
jgi:hypothetical protein